MCPRLLGLYDYLFNAPGRLLGFLLSNKPIDTREILKRLDQSQGHDETGDETGQ